MLTIIPVTGIPDIRKNDNIGELIVEKLQAAKQQLQRGDIVVISQKIVSKAEGRVIHLSNIVPSTFAKKIGSESGKDPRLVEVILSQTKKIVRMKNGHLIVETVQGFICANAGIDQSNVVKAGSDSVTLLPKDSDKSADKIRKSIKTLTGHSVPIIITDTFGRAWRMGQVNFAIGVAGMKPIVDYRGSRDMYRRILHVTEIAVADEISGAAELVMNKADKIPVAIVRGYNAPKGNGRGTDLIRPEESDLFR